EATFLRQKCSEIENQIETMIVSADQKRAEVTALKQKVTELIAQGKAALEENKNNAALDKFKAVLELDNENKEARELVVTTEQKLKDELEIERLFANGKKYFEQNNYNEALNAFNELTSIAPTHPETQKYLQKIQTQIDQSEKTKKLLSDAQSYLKKQKFDKAIDSFNKVLKIDPQNGEAANGLKKAEKSRAKVDMAVESPEPTVEKSSGKVLRFAFVVFILVVLGAAGWYYYYGIQGALSNDEYLSLASDAREQMLSLKNSAEGVNAETWAEATFTLALQAEQNAENEFESKKYAKANQLFVEAGDLFRKSSEEAKTNSASATASADLESLKNMVAKARKDMLREKSAAEKAGAPTVAKQTFNSALAKEKEGERASQAEDRDSLVASQQAFLRAKTDYKSARVTAGKLARLRRNSEAAKSQMTSTKRRVPAKEKGQNPSYRKALALESTGNKQLKAGDYNKARKSFQQAKGLYAQAITDALRRGADDAKKSMLATKARITGDRMTDPDYQQSVEIESRGNDAYASSNFTKAEEHFKRSATLYNAVLNKPQKPESRKAPEVAQNNKQEKAAIAIANALNRYKSSLENGDVQGLKTLLLLSKDQEKAWFGFFKIAKNINVQFDKKSQRIRDSNATVDLLVRMSYYNKTTNRDEKRDFSTNLVFEIIDGAWEIAATK
ncbi:MAG: hypothetical protein ACE5G1_03290, partial [bacterium]